MKRPVRFPWPPLQRLSSFPARWLTIPLLIWCVFGLLLFFGARHTQWATAVSRWTAWRKGSKAAHRMPHTPILPELEPRQPCYGPRGLLLSESPDDELRYAALDKAYPVPFVGSHNALGINQTWMSADGRYGPYGFGEDEASHGRSKVNWDTVDWGRLQDACLSRNSHRFPDANRIPTTRFADNTRFTLLRKSMLEVTPTWDKFSNTRRTALVVRAYDNFQYKAEDLWFIRSLITEASLKTGGEYVVCLLVNIQDSDKKIFDSKENYDKAFQEANLPPELQSIAILWDDNWLESWYKAIEEHRTMWAVNQPLQLFALHYPEFDHYWQIELDQRFLGDAGEYLDAVSSFARREPRKQALERATFSYSEEVSGPYEHFKRSVDVANKGGSRAWGPVRIPDISPIGPEPPVADASMDDFAWGVGEDADVIVTSFCADILDDTDWVFRDYIEHFETGLETPRWWCPPAIMRGSRTLLLAVHEALHKRGMSIPSEAVLPSFALWHGLKMVNVPQPSYMHKWVPSSEFLDETVRNRSEWRRPDQKPWFGWEPDESPDGKGHAEPQSFADRGLSWWWTSWYPRVIMDVWIGREAVTDDMPGALALSDGIVYAPNIAMHPVKS